VLRAAGQRATEIHIGGPSPETNWVAPVMLPPGRLRLATRPSWIGSEPISNTIGMVVVAAYACAGSEYFFSHSSRLKTLGTST
jgi:hypothetical protein